MGNNKDMANVSKATIGRLPAYHRYLTEKKAEGEKTVSSAAIAEELHLSAVQVRKDFAVIGSVAGRPKLGFDVEELIAGIDRFLGYDNVSDAVLVGAGGLGSALVGYDGFKNYGLNIVAAFDRRPQRGGARSRRQAGRRGRARHMELRARAPFPPRKHRGQKRGHGSVARDPVPAPR